MLVINKVISSHLTNWFRLIPIFQTDLASFVGADLNVMARDAAKMRDGGPTLFTSIRNNEGTEAVASLIEAAWRASGAASASQTQQGTKVASS